MQPDIKGDTGRMEGATALMVASAAGREDVVRSLRAWGARVDVATRQEDTALIYAASASWPEIVRFLLLSGADPNQANRAGATALMRAIPAPWPPQDEPRALDCVNALLASGAQIDAKARDGATALHEAIGRTQLRFVRLLLLRGADPNLAGGPQNVSPLLHAIRADLPEVAAVLLRGGAEPTEPGLVEAVSYGLRTHGEDMIEVLRAASVPGSKSTP
jgi:serine/threonine-protein phosphatase 6 regulatory ankyrin repeat subunit B